MAKLIWAATSAANLQTDSNWKPVSIRNSLYSWSASGSGTAEYYVELAAGGNPGITEPDNVQVAGSNITEATVGSLAAGRWDYGNNDSLGFNTIYVRMSDGTDPDASADGAVTWTANPITGDNVQFVSNTNAGSSGLDSPTVTLTSLDIDASYTGTIGSTTDDEWHISATTTNIGRNLGTGSPAGSGRVLLDYGSIQNATTVWKTSGSASDSNREAVRIRGTHTSNTITVHDGLVGLGTNNEGELTTFALSQFGGTVNCGSGVTLKDPTVDGSSSILRILNGVNSGDTLTLNAGEVFSYGTGTIPTLKLMDTGTFFDHSTGTYTTTTINDNATLFVNSAAKTYTTMHLYGTLDLSSATGTITISTLNILSDNARVLDPYNLLAGDTDFVLGAGIKTFDYDHGGGITIRKEA